MSQLVNASQLDWDLSHIGPEAREKFERYWANRSNVSRQVFENHPHIHLEIGAGSGWFVAELARRYPERHYVAIDRCRMRSRTLLAKAEKAKLPNLSAFRGNAIPLLIHQIPDASVERLYILYPAPFVRGTQRRNRWYLHPVMAHFCRILKPGGKIVWASDQKFYIDEAHYVSERHYNLKTLVHGEIKPNSWNDLETFPQGRTKFEFTFLKSGQSCYELISEKVS